ncbi:MAG: 5-carboxymethyl-2-hydroxymuconate isomerase [Woeseiaceae bacterium]|nr:5-carboxymethyl-2-hydroxymuconate isomerase [Woeseiaceae bacterium]
MPHIIVEYSANLESDIDFEGLVAALHEKAVSIDALPTGGLRVRAARRDLFKVGDGDPDNGFINVLLRIAKGRPVELQKEVGQMLFGVVTDYVRKVYDRRAMALSFEIQEINPETRWNQGNIREYIAERAAGKEST